MIDLYALTSPNVRKIIIALEELGLPYQMKLVNVYTGEQFAPDFVKLNPNSKIPVIVDHEGPGGRPYTVFESGAILLYLADKTGRLLPVDTAARFDVIQWLMIQMTGIGPNFGQFVHFKHRAPSGNDYSMSRFRTEVRRLYDVLEARLGHSPYLGGAEYSIADIATFPFMRDREEHGVIWDEYPNLHRWVSDISARPAVQVAQAKIKAIGEPKRAMRSKATDEDLDQYYYRRGRYARG